MTLFGNYNNIDTKYCIWTKTTNASDIHTMCVVYIIRKHKTYLISDVYYLAPGGGCEVLFSPGLCVCLSVCVYVCPANILVFYFSAIRRDIDLKFIQDTYMVVFNSLK